MASITISSVSTTRKPLAISTMTGDEQFLVIDKGGKPSTIGVDQILDKIDDDIIDRIDDDLMDTVESQLVDKFENMIDDMIEDRLDNIDSNNNLTWNDV